MIVDSMTYLEIRKEFLSDCRDVQNYFRPELINYDKKFSAYVRKSNMTCISKTYKIKTFRGNIISIVYSAKNRSQHNKPVVAFYTSFQTAKGILFAVRTNFKDDKVTILTPHFIKRYRERILGNDESLYSDEVVSEFINKDNFALSFKINDDLENIAKCFDGHYENQGNDCVAIVDSGWIFESVDSKIRLCKTIVTENMLSRKQKALFDNMWALHSELKSKCVWRKMAEKCY